jgi:hypothetical protein
MRAIGASIGCRLPPLPPYGEYKEVAGIDCLADRSLRLSPMLGKSVFPTERDKVNTKPASKYSIELADDVLKGYALLHQIVRRSNKYSSNVGKRHKAYYPIIKTIKS